MGILTYLHEQNICTAATTHYSELKIFALNHKGVENASMEFNVETLQPTFRLLIGVPGKSNAFEISRRLGLMEDVINRAKEFLSQEDIRFEDIIGNMEYNRLKAEEERKEAQMLRNQLRRLKDELENEKIELKERQNKILQRAREEAKRILRDAKEESNQIIKNMQQLSKVVEEKERNRALEEARKNLRRINEIEERIGSADEPVVNHFEPPRDLKLGETVYVINLNQKGQVLTLPDQNGELQLQVGIMKVNSHISNLMRTKEQVHENKHVSKKISLRISTVKSELDLRGMNVEEALIDIDKYLDDVFLAGLNEVTIIHGKGTGVLRSGIHDHLRTHPHVKSFRLGKYGEGETGVTIVEIK